MSKYFLSFSLSIVILTSSKLLAFEYKQDGFSIEDQQISVDEDKWSKDRVGSSDIYKMKSGNYGSGEIIILNRDDKMKVTSISSKSGLGYYDISYKPKDPDYESAATVSRMGAVLCKRSTANKDEVANHCVSTSKEKCEKLTKALDQMTFREFRKCADFQNIFFEDTGELPEVLKLKSDLKKNFNGYEGLPYRNPSGKFTMMDALSACNVYLAVNPSFKTDKGHRTKMFVNDNLYMHYGDSKPGKK